MSDHRPGPYGGLVPLELTSLIVDDQDEAIAFFVDVLDFDLVEDEPSTTTDGRPKRWVVVRPPDGGAGLLLAAADGDRQVAAVGDQYAGRVGLFLRVDDFDAAHERLTAAGVEIVRPARDEPYGRVLVFTDIAGNRWDLLGPGQVGDGEEDGSPAAEPTTPAAGGPLLVRRERPDDVAAVRAIHAAAFERGDGEPPEAGLVDALRLDGWLPALSWVAERDGVVVGHNICSRGRVGDTPCVGLGPIGVAPGEQGGGVGSALMLAMIGAADATGEPLIALLGDPAYYRRFGFVASTEVGIEPPDARWGHYFQVRTLAAWVPAIRGRFHYAAPFDDV